MEISIIIGFVAIFLIVNIASSKMQEPKRNYLKVISGLLLVLLIWLADGGYSHWKIIITILVMGNIFNALKKQFGITKSP